METKIQKILSKILYWQELRNGYLAGRYPYTKTALAIQEKFIAYHTRRLSKELKTCLNKLQGN